MNRIFILVGITSMVIGISYGLHGPILPIFAKNVVGASYPDLGIIGLANFIPYMFIPLLVGILLDRFNNGYLLVVGTVLSIVSIYLLSVAQTVPEVVVLRIMVGVAHAFFWPPCESIISNHSSRRDRVRNISWFTMFFAIGFMIGPMIGSILLDNSDITYRVLFQYTGLFVVVAMAAALMASRSEAKRKARLNLKKSSQKFSLASVREMRRFPQVIGLITFCTASLGVVLTIYPAFLNDRGMTDRDILMLFFILGISRVVSLGLTGKVARRTSLTLIVATFTLAVGLGVSAVADSFAVFAFAVVLMGFGFSVIFPLTLEIILTKTPSRMTGRIIGAYEAVFGAGWAVGPLIAGSLTQSFGGWMPYAALFVIGMAATVMAILSRKSLEPQWIRS